MIRFIARSAYLLLVPQGKEVIRNRALFPFLRNSRMFKAKLQEEVIRLKELCIHMAIAVGKLRRRSLISFRVVEARDDFKLLTFIWTTFKLKWSNTVTFSKIYPRKHVAWCVYCWVMWLDVSMATVYMLTAKSEEMCQLLKDRCCPDSAVNKGPEHSQQIDQ